jgi:hypothetical protein
VPAVTSESFGPNGPAVWATISNIHTYIHNHKHPPIYIRFQGWGIAMGTY